MLVAEVIPFPSPHLLRHTSQVSILLRCTTFLTLFALLLSSVVAGALLPELLHLTNSCASELIFVRLLMSSLYWGIPGLVLVVIFLVAKSAGEAFLAPQSALRKMLSSRWLPGGLCTVFLLWPTLAMLQIDQASRRTHLFQTYLSDREFKTLKISHHIECHLLTDFSFRMRFSLHRAEFEKLIEARRFQPEEQHTAESNCNLATPAWWTHSPIDTSWRRYSRRSETPHEDTGPIFEHLWYHDQEQEGLFQVCNP
ncbi:hypothetical protein MRY87_12705 [bacterium]|nr:hypothetical protein [bacterium]